MNSSRCSTNLVALERNFPDRDSTEGSRPDGVVEAETKNELKLNKVVDKVVPFDSRSTTTHHDILSTLYENTTAP